MTTRWNGPPARARASIAGQRSRKSSTGFIGSARSAPAMPEASGVEPTSIDSASKDTGGRSSTLTNRLPRSSPVAAAW